MKLDPEQKESNPFHSFFDSQSIAMIGSLAPRLALGKPFFGGDVLLNNLLDCEYSGEIYLVNPSYTEFQGMKVYPDIREVSQGVELAFTNAPRRAVPSIVRDCAQKGVKGMVIGSDGFAESDEEGKRLQREIVAISKSTSIRLLGPNTLGIMNSSNGLVTFPFFTGSSSDNKLRVRRGNIALACQTGLVTPQATPYKDYSWGVSKVCDFGNKCDVNESDFLEYLANDSDTEVIAMELEGMVEGHRFLERAKEVVRNKPILVFKPGRTKQSARALMSHTGSLAGGKEVWQSALKQAGIIEVEFHRELIEIARVFSTQPLPRGNRLGVVTMTGAGAVEVIDIATESGLAIPQLSPETSKKLTKIHPALARNPSDVGASSYTKEEPPYSEAIEELWNDENVDCLLCSLFSTFPADYYIELLGKIRKPENKPITLWVFGPDWEETSRIYVKLQEEGYPIYWDMETAVKALAAMYRYRKIKERMG